MRPLKLGTALVAGLLAACTSYPDAQSRGARPAHFNVPPQVIYRIDDHRFVTWEDYSDCHHGVSYYNDTRQGIRTELGRDSTANFQGRVINADPIGAIIVLAGAPIPQTVCSDRGCRLGASYSMDAGRSFHGITYSVATWNPFADSARYTIIATRDALYVGDKISEITGHVVTTRYPLPWGRAPVQYDAELPADARTPSGQDRFTCDASIRPTNLSESK